MQVKRYLKNNMTQKGKGSMKRTILIIVITLVLMVTSVVAVYADDCNIVENSSMKIEGKKFQIEVKAPGEDGVESHDESYCGQIAHIHTEKCYDESLTQLVCGMNSHAHEKCSASESSVWNGMKDSIEVRKGKNGYVFLSVYPARAYEMSNHMVSKDGGAHNDIPQTLIMVEANEDYEWNANGKYAFAVSNYEVLYCCDAETGYNDGVYYRRLNLEDSSYYDEEDAAHIRSIVTNSYPYVSVEEMKENLYQEGFEYAYDLNRSEIIAAVQAAIWAYANEGSNYVYSRTFDVTTNPQWGTVAHDYTNQLDVWWKTGKRKFSTDPIVEERINKLIEHLKQQTAVYADKNQIIISSLEVVDTVPIQEKDDFYNVVMRLKLNSSGSSQADDLTVTVLRNGDVIEERPVELGVEVYDLGIVARNGDVIEVIVSGEQILPKGVYFYEPEGGRDVSQCLVGVAEGATNVYDEESFVLEIENPINVDLLLQKTDEQGKTLTGAKFELYVKVFEHLDASAEAYEGEELIIYMGSYEVDENGQLILENLIPGRYSLFEVESPEGYEKLASAIQFEITENGGVVLGDNVEIEKLVYIEGNALSVKNAKEPEPTATPTPEPTATPTPTPYIDMEIINNLPKTEDNTNIGVYVCFLLASIFGLFVCQKRKR